MIPFTVRKDSVDQARDLLDVNPDTPVAPPETDVVAIQYTDEVINRAIGELQDRTGWHYGPIDLAAVVRDFRDWSHSLWTLFLPRHWNGVAIEQPPILFCFEDEGARTLGHYQPGRNDSGLRWEISINPRHIIQRPETQLAETILHELFHCFEDVTGIAPQSRNGYHSAFLRKSLNQIGIPCTRYGATLGIRVDSPFTDWAREQGLEGRPAVSIETIAALPPVRKRKRATWTCSCPSEIGVAVQVATASELRARCLTCGEMFKRRPEGGRDEP